MNRDVKLYMAGTFTLYAKLCFFSRFWLVLLEEYKLFNRSFWFEKLFLLKLVKQKFCKLQHFLKSAVPGIFQRLIIAALPLTLALINEYEPLVTISGPDKLFLTKVVKCKILQVTNFFKISCSWNFLQIFIYCTTNLCSNE